MFNHKHQQQNATINYLKLTKIYPSKVFFNQSSYTTINWSSVLYTKFYK